MDDRGYGGIPLTGLWKTYRLWAWVILVVLAAGTTSSCSTRSASQSDSTKGAATAELAARGFLDGANSDDYTSMGLLFGTDKGPAVDQFGVTDVEQRMIFLASILKHESYELRQADLAMLGPDRVRWEATMTGTRKGTVVVPVVTVPDRHGRWYVERLNLDALTASPVP